MARPGPRECCARTLVWLATDSARDQNLAIWAKWARRPRPLCPIGAGLASQRGVVQSSVCNLAKASLGVAFALCLMGCAGVGGKYAASPVDTQGRVTSARSTDSGLVISAVELSHYASNYFGLVEMTFENATARWVHLSRLSLDFGDAARNEAVLVPSGADLETWYLSTLQRNDIRATNHGTALGALFAVGQVVALAGAISGKRGLAAVGGAVAAGTATAALVDRQNSRVQSAEGVHLVPQSHLLAIPFSVPPGLFTQKNGSYCRREASLPPASRRCSSTTTSRREGTSECW